MPDRRPEISVLIGVFNNESTVGKAIASIREQTAADLELIVIDDGSRDSSAEAARAAIAGDRRCELVELGRNLGIAASLNLGLERARADVVAVQDADDFADAQRLERQLATLASDPGVAVVGALMREVAPDGRELRARTSIATGDVTGALMRFNPIPNGIAAFRRLPIVDRGGYDPRYSYATEYDLWLRVAERHRVFVLDEVLATRVMGGDQVAARFERKQAREAIAIRLAAMRRRRSAAGAIGLVRPAISYLAPLPLKRALRRARGEAP
jgi:glycosyltransferase involved in cell wall biosynthesis